METLLPEGRARKLAGLSPAERRFFQAVLRAFPELGGLPSPDRLAALAATHALDAGAVLAKLSERDPLQRGGRTGAITCAYPFSGRLPPHVVEAEGTHPVYAMCALAALNPYVTQHINRFGRYALDPKRRPPAIDYEAPILPATSQTAEAADGAADGAAAGTYCITGSRSRFRNSEMAHFCTNRDRLP